MTEPVIAVDTSIAIALLARSHQEHVAVRAWCEGRTLALSGHAVAETYSVLTRLHGDLRRTGLEAAMLIDASFEEPLTLSEQAGAQLPAVLSASGIVGGAVYDALVGLAAAEHNADLATRDGRARLTYDKVGARTVMVT